MSRSTENAQLNPMLGKAAGDFELVRVMSDGPFSWVFQGCHRENESTCVIKVAKPLDKLVRRMPDWVFPTRANRFTTGGVTEVVPDPEQLIYFEFNSLKKMEGRGVVKTGKFDSLGPFWYYQMDYANAPNLRQWARTETVTLDVLSQIVETVVRLSEAGVSHGDLKPDNILVNPHGVTLIDPGYFGPIDAEPANVDFCAVTTPSYYPFLAADDLLALGIMIWELAAGVHPLDGYSVRKSDAVVGGGLESLLQEREAVGQYFLSPLWNLKAPKTIIGNTSEELENFLLKGLRLKKVENDVLDIAPGFESAAELLAGLDALKAHGVTSLRTVH